MLNQSELDSVKECIEEFFRRMTLEDFMVTVVNQEDAVEADIQLQETQFLIGQNGQTLFDAARILGIIANKKLQKSFYLKVDINEYKKKKIEYLKNLASDAADQVAQTKEKKELPPMSSYERMVVHSELAGRKDVLTESRGEGPDRRIIISPVP